MGRKLVFDREVALQQALKAFWWEGFDGTSLDELLKVMEIKTSSFYNSFENKELLFFEALKYYRQQIGGPRLGLLNSEKLTGRKSLLKYFDDLVLRKGHEKYPPGCFMMKTAVTLTDSNSKIGQEVMSSIANLERGFEAALSRGKESGEFIKHLDAKETAKLFLACAYGLSVLTRTKKTNKELLSTAHSLIHLISKNA